MVVPWPKTQTAAGAMAAMSDSWAGSGSGMMCQAGGSQAPEGGRDTLAPKMGTEAGGGAAAAWDAEARSRQIRASRARTPARYAATPAKGATNRPPCEVGLEERTCRVLLDISRCRFMVRWLHIRSCISGRAWRGSPGGTQGSWCHNYSPK